ncbi:peptidase [Sinosporangium siamense]|uniref:Peptidase n=2 Tax=Sinosporangium siamense TaxID=1367973 RepID=A0A919RC61_9ACTN|nr:peptidase [Sinosporangium siamense]
MGAPLSGATVTAPPAPADRVSTQHTPRHQTALHRPADRPSPDRPRSGRRNDGRVSTVPAGTGAGSGALADVVEHVATIGDAEERRVLDYWTPARMAAAVPASLLGRDLAGTLNGTVHGTVAGAARPLTGGTGTPPEREPQRRGTAASPAAARAATSTAGARWTAGGAVTRTTGRVFLTVNRVDFVCSASVIRSANRDVVVTAGHCVKDGRGAWAENWTFVPGYRAGHKPYGSFTARRMFVAGPWSRRGDDSYDVGMVALNTARGRHVADAAGTQEIAFNSARGAVTFGFGYPADPPYNGESLVYCAGRVSADPHGQTRDQGLRCDMTAGSSGGPWLSHFDSASGRGTVTSVSSFKYSDDRRTMYGPYFGESAKMLFTTAERA